MVAGITHLQSQWRKTHVYSAPSSNSILHLTTSSVHESRPAVRHRYISSRPAETKLHFGDEHDDEKHSHLSISYNVRQFYNCTTYTLACNTTTLHLAQQSLPAHTGCIINGPKFVLLHSRCKILFRTGSTYVHTTFPAAVKYIYIYILYIIL